MTVHLSSEIYIANPSLNGLVTCVNEETGEIEEIKNVLFVKKHNDHYDIVTDKHCYTRKVVLEYGEL